MKNLKVGDKVKIISANELENYIYEEPFVTEVMLYLSKKNITHKIIEKRHEYFMLECGFSWRQDWLIPASNKLPIE